MGNKRQRAARKKFREENGLVNTENAAEKPSATSPEGSAKKEKKRTRESNEGVSEDAPAAKHVKNAPAQKHPLRIIGYRPGELCFVCKEQGHVAKYCPKKGELDVKKMCLLCRRVGHTLKSCPENPERSQDEGRVCYNCGDKGHRLADCPKPKDEGTLYAACFVCGEKGHLSRTCPSNARGIYPKGGCCKVCGGVSHLAKDCPEEGKAPRKNTSKNPNRLGTISTQAAPASDSKSGGKRIVFSSGDALDDDFEDAAVNGTDYEEVEAVEGGDVEANAAAGGLKADMANTRSAGRQGDSSATAPKKAVSKSKSANTARGARGSASKVVVF